MSYRGRPQGNYGNKRRKRTSVHANFSQHNQRNQKIGDNALTGPNTRQPKQNSFSQMGILAVKTILKHVVSRVMPISNLLCTGYGLADIIYKNWSSIKQLYQNVRDGNLTETAITALTIAGNIALDKLPSLQADFIWSRITNNNPNSQLEASKNVFYDVIGGLTQSETFFAKQFIEKHNIGTSRKPKRVQTRRASQKEIAEPKKPKAMDYV